MGSRQMEMEEDALEQQYNNGDISLAEYNREMQELQRGYRYAAIEAAQDAYDDELERW